GVSPSMIPDLLALVGDTADGIPGIPGWGMKTAAAVLRVHHAIEQIPDDPAQWRVAVRGAERLAANLCARRIDAILYKRLATLRVDVRIAETLVDLEWKGTRRAAFEGLCKELGFGDLAQRPWRWREA